MSTRSFLLLISLIIFVFNAQAQTIETWIEENEKVPVEKIYLHTDAEFYFQNDSIWFKVYLMDSRSGKLIPGAENVYISILDKNGKAVLETILLSVNGQASGCIAIPRTISQGNYLLQAFTNYLLNFSDDAWFQKQVSISRPTTYAGSSAIKERTKSIISDVSFFPEGGNLLENVTNLVAFKAINKAGYGVKTMGSVRDERGKTVASFKTDYKGMGLFFLTPEPGKSYYALVNGLPSFRYNFEALKENIKIQLVNHTSNEVILNIACNSEQFVDQNFYLAAMYRGEVQFYHTFKMEGLNQVLKFDSNILKPGVNRLVLLNSQLEPFSERLLFSQNIDVNFLEVTTDNGNYESREKVNLNLKNTGELGSEEIANLSVSVINKQALEMGGKSQNILSYLLIDSELNGFYESSMDFFIDNEFSSEVKLRFLMLTNGWSSYFWNSFPNKNDTLKFIQKAGLDIKGVATNILTNNPLEKGEITMIIQKDGEVAFLSQETDTSGNFIFPGLIFKDTANVHVQAKSENGRMNTKIEIGTAFKEFVVSLDNIKVTFENEFVPSPLKNLNYQTNLAFRKNRLPLIRKRAKTESDIRDPEHFRLYESADFVLEINENKESFENIIDFMVGKVPGVDISGDNVRIRGTSNFAASSSPLFLIDGVPLIANNTFGIPQGFGPDNNQVETDSHSEEQLIQTVKSIPLNDVDKIEVLKSPQNLAVFGVKGSNGVIAIYTRMGKQGGTDKVARGVIEKQIVGYSSKREFYSPKYTPEKESNRSDFRTTLYWNPNIITANGLAELEFFTSDQKGIYSIYVEGITESGKICLGTAEFEVAK